MLFQPNESLYDQKPLEIKDIPATGSQLNAGPKVSRFSYNDEPGSGHIAAPSNSSDFFADNGSSTGGSRSYSQNKPRVSNRLIVLSSFVAPLILCHSFPFLKLFSTFIRLL